MSVVCRATNRIVLVRPACTLLIVSTELWFWTLDGVIATLGHYTQNLNFFSSSFRFVKSQEYQFTCNPVKTTTLF